MNKLSKIVKATVLAAAAVVVLAAPSFAAVADCVGDGTKFPNLTTGGASDEFPVKCGQVFEDGTMVYIHGKNQAACSQASTIISNPEGCQGDDLNTIVKTIINTVIFIVGILTVVMIILGGVNYAISAGDPGKVTKAKNTIMYGIIGLVICILAFAIVNFILGALAG